MISILQAGVPKSGNYWLWTLIQAALRRAGVEIRSYVRGHPIQAVARTWHLSFPEQADLDFIRVRANDDFMEVLPRYAEKITDIDRYVAAVTHCWTHSPVSGPRAEQTLARFGRRVYLVRDPRAVIASRARYDVSAYKRAEFGDLPATAAESLERAVDAEPARWLDNVSSWLRFAERQPVVIVRYEDLRQDFEATCGRLLRDLGLPHDPAAVEFVGAAGALDAMRQGAPKHVGDGAVDGWRALLTDAHLARLPTEVLTLAASLGYDV